MFLASIDTVLVPSFFRLAKECLQRLGGAIVRPDKKTPQPGQAWGADKANEAGNLNGNYASPASTLFAEANQVIATFPAIMTRKRKREAESKVLDLWLQALAASREVVV